MSSKYYIKLRKRKEPPIENYSNQQIIKKLMERMHKQAGSNLIFFPSMLLLNININRECVLSVCKEIAVNPNRQLLNVSTSMNVITVEVSWQAHYSIIIGSLLIKQPFITISIHVIH